MNKSESHDDDWHRVTLQWPDRVGSYRWRYGAMYSRFGIEVQAWDKDLGWFRCPNIGIKSRIAELIKKANKSRVGK